MLSGEVVDAEHSWRRTLLGFGQADDAQESVPTGWQAKPMPKSGSGSTTKGKAQQLELEAQAQRTLCVGGQEFGEPFGEGVLGTTRVAAGEAANVQDELDGVLTDGQVPRRADVAVVDAIRDELAVGAGGRRASGVSLDREPIGAETDVIGDQARWKQVIKQRVIRTPGVGNLADDEV